jgi:hypothetical protein
MSKTEIRVGNVRVAYIRPGDRAPEKNWAGQSVISVRTYDPSGSLRQGPEIPISDLLGFIAALCQVAENQETSGG